MHWKKISKKSPISATRIESSMFFYDLPILPKWKTAFSLASCDNCPGMGYPMYHPPHWDSSSRWWSGRWAVSAVGPAGGTQSFLRKTTGKGIGKGWGKTMENPKRPSRGGIWSAVKRTSLFRLISNSGVDPVNKCVCLKYSTGNVCLQSSSIKVIS